MLVSCRKDIRAIKRKCWGDKPHATTHSNYKGTRTAWREFRYCVSSLFLSHSVPFLQFFNSLFPLFLHSFFPLFFFSFLPQLISPFLPQLFPLFFFSFLPLGLFRFRLREVHVFCSVQFSKSCYLSFLSRLRSTFNSGAVQISASICLFYFIFPQLPTSAFINLKERGRGALRLKRAREEGDKGLSQLVSGLLWSPFYLALIVLNYQMYKK